MSPDTAGTQSWPRRVARLAWRAARLRCPNCGTGTAFESWFRMRPACTSCGLEFERREQGYIVGGYMLNIVVAEGIFLSGFLGVLLATWPDPPWGVLQVVAPVVMLVAPILTYPFSKTLFLAMDLAVRPVGRE